MVNIIACYGFGAINDWFKGSDFDKCSQKKTRGRIVSTGTNIAQNIVPQLKQWLPKGKYRTSKGGKVFESQWEVGNTVFDIMTYEQDPQEFESVTLDWILFDEPPPYKIYAASVSRFRFGGAIMFFMTPLSDSAWIYDELILKESKKRGIVYADVEANCKQHGVRGFLEHSDIEQMVAEYTEDEREARASGKFMHLAGLVYKEFDENVHLIEPFELNDNYTLYCALDPHPRTPHAVMWLAVDNQGTKFIVDELFVEGSPEELAGKIKAKESQFQIKVKKRIIDPMALVKDQTKDVPILQDQLKKLGLSFKPASKDLSSGILRVKQALKYGRDENNVLVKTPELFIFNTCERTQWEFKRYVWQEWSVKMQDQRNSKGKPKDKDDHMMENLYRLLLLEPKHIYLLDEDFSIPEETNQYTGY